MLFAGFTSGYIVSRGAGNWLQFNLPQSLYISTAIILASSITMFIAQRAIKQNNLNLVKTGLTLSLMTAIVFSFSQFKAWNDLVDMGIVFAGSKSNAAGSYLYILTGLHLLHLFGGIIALIITFVKTILEKYSATNSLGIEMCAIYWHFLTILWVYLLLFLHFIR